MSTIRMHRGQVPKQTELSDDDPWSDAWQVARDIAFLLGSLGGLGLTPAERLSPAAYCCLACNSGAPHKWTQEPTCR